MAPVDLEGVLKGAVVEVSFTLHHHHIDRLDWDFFRVEVLEVKIIRGVGPPQTDRVGWGASGVSDGDIWFPSMVPSVLGESGSEHF